MAAYQGCDVEKLSKPVIKSGLLPGSLRFYQVRANCRQRMSAKLNSGGKNLKVLLFTPCECYFCEYHANIRSYALKFLLFTELIHPVDATNSPFER